MPRTNTKSQIRVILVLGLLVAAVYTPARLASAQDQAQPDYAETGAKNCLKCHDEQPTNFILQTPHGQRADDRTPFGAQDCETCHGASVKHREAPKDMPDEERPEVAREFGTDSPTPVAEQNEVCLNCHQSGQHLNWQGSPHQFEDVPCAACHQVHAQQDAVQRKETQPEVCYDCHAVIRAQAQRISHHPIREGKMACSDCHNPHGSFGPKLLKEATVNEVCYECHTEKRGPFLWEHPPVVEDCRNCHTPHGATQPRLLKMRTPQLCQTCHLAAFHPSTAYSGDGVPPRGATRQLLSKGCQNCHSQIHGSNHPSGARFIR